MSEQMQAKDDWSEPIDRLEESVAVERNMTLAFELARAIVDDPTLLEQIPDDATVVLVPEDDSELAQFNKAMGQQAAISGETVHLHRIPASEETNVLPFRKHLTPPYDEVPGFAELADAPIEALEGLSKNEAEALRKAFNIRTIRDLAESTFVLRAQAIVNLALAERKSSRSRAVAGARQSS